MPMSPKDERNSNGDRNGKSDLDDTKHAGLKKPGPGPRRVFFDAGHFLKTENNPFPNGKAFSRSNHSIYDDMVYKTPHHPRVQKDRRTQLTTDKRQTFWELYGNKETCKIEQALWDTSTSRATLTKTHYIVIPIWWDGESTQAGFNLSYITQGLNQISTYYDAMSFGKHSLTYEMWSQRVLTGVTPDNADFGNSEAAARAIVDSAGKVLNQDYTNILLVYNVARSGPFSGAGGWAGVNDYFAWTTYFGSDIRATFEVVRHEIGHNYGHNHHLANTYGWRVADGAEGVSTTVYDGFDMMSGGNAYDKSDFSVASKWQYNWVVDDAVVLMQPEGPTTSCPTCLSSVSNLVLKPFDNSNIQPSSSNKMAVQIPVMGHNGEMFSYWLSYRTGNDGDAADGLSIHFSGHRICSGMYGSSFDSVNYDAYGNTADDTSDSSVTLGTCYVVAPCVEGMDYDFAAVHQVQPIACVTGLNQGIDITISVAFLDPDSPPANTVSLSSQRELTCSTSPGVNSGNINLDVSSGKTHLLHYVGTGRRGTVAATMCSTTSATAYFYDTYPYSPLVYGSPMGYGAYKSLSVPASSGCSNFKSEDYMSAHGEVYVLVKADSSTSSGTVRFRSTCQVEQCHGSQYLSNGFCQDCPSGSVAPHGSTSVSACISCADFGGDALHPRSEACVIPTEYDASITTGTGWRLLADSSMLVEGWKWDVKYIEFFSLEDCSASSRVNTNSGTPTDSGNAGDPWWSASNAFQESGTWGGRGTADGVFWIGMEFNSDVTVRCIKVDQLEARKLYVQARTTSASGSAVWQNAFLAEGLVDGDNTIVIRSDTGDDDDDDDNVGSAVGWRLEAQSSETSSGWVWDVDYIEFFASKDCSSSSKIDPASGTIIDSGNAGEPWWSAANAFEQAGIWGGRPSNNNVFWIGLDSLNPAVIVQCVKMTQTLPHLANSVSIQSRSSGSNTWKDVYSIGGLGPGVNTFVIGTATISPTTSPTTSPTSSPSDSPTASPTRSPTSSSSGAVGWRLEAKSSETNSGWVWDVDYIEFFASKDCSSSSKIDPASGTIIDSGNAGEPWWSAANAFEQAGIWGGRPSNNNVFWIGLDSLNPAVIVQCVKMTQTLPHVANSVSIQSRSSGSNTWKDVYSIGGLGPGVNTIMIDDTADMFSFHLKTDSWAYETKAELKVRGSSAVLVSYDPPADDNTEYSNVVALQNGVEYEICAEDDYGDGMTDFTADTSDDGWIKALKTDGQGRITTLAEIAGNAYTYGPYCVCFTTTGLCEVECSSRLTLLIRPLPEQTKDE